MIEFNINHAVKVRLTDAGRKELERQHEQIYGSTPEPLRTDTYRPVTEDEDGWSKWQLWCLMNSFGHMTKLCGKLPFDTTIRIEDEK